MKGLEEESAMVKLCRERGGRFGDEKWEARSPFKLVGSAEQRSKARY